MKNSLLPFEEARVTINELFIGTDVTVTPEDVERLAPLVASSNVISDVLREDDISYEDLIRLIWIEKALRDPAPREEIVRRILGRIHTRQRHRIVSMIAEA
jgi:hypothetical protein